MNRKKEKVVSYIIKTVIVTTVLLSSLSLTLWAAPVETLDADEVLWHTSFQPNDGKTFLENTIDTTKGSKNIEELLNVVKVKGDISNKVVLNTVSGSSDFNSNEAKTKIFDNTPNTKWLTNSNVPANNKPVYVQFSFAEVKTLDRYAIVSANDASERNPKSWTLYGLDGSEWVSLDTQVDQSFNERYEMKEYSIKNPKAYTTYKLEITANKGNNQLTQFGDLLLGTGEESDVTRRMVTMLSKGPSETWNQKSNAGWDDEQALQISGIHKGTDDAYAWNVLYKDVDVKITDKTALSYLIFPGLVNSEYDYNWTQMNMAVDLKFDDGTYLSEYSINDTNGNLLTPQGQGDSRTLLTNQWNQIMARLGEYTQLRGKIVSQVLVAYDNPDNKAENDVKFQNYLDDIKLFNEAKQDYDNENLAEYVDILRGTNDSRDFSRGLTGPMVTTPHGFNFWAPVTNPTDNKLYTYQQNGDQGTLKHISVSHEPSYWIGERGTWEYMVNTSINPVGSESIGTKERAAKFTHENEVAKAHYYGVTFDEGNAKGSKLELSPTEHGSSTKFTFGNEAMYHNVILDIVRGTNKKVVLNNDKKSFTAEMRPNSDVNGSNGMKTMYVYGEFDTKWVSERYGNDAKNSVLVNFGSASEVEMKVATSFISIEQAKKNLELELSDKTFDTVYQEAKDIWNDKLDVITVEGASYEEKVTLYSNLYRTFIYPNLLSENTGTNENPVWKYKSTVSEEVKEGTLYYNNGFWDTYHTTWATYALLTPKQNTEMLNGLVEHYNDGGWVPRWVAPGGTNSMVGTSSDVIFADAAMNNVDFDLETAYQSAIKNASVVNVENLASGGRAELNTSIFRGYTTNSTREGFSWSMEGYINDYGISQMATLLAQQAEDDGKAEEAQRYRDEATYYQNRALNYVLLFDGSSEEVTDKWFKGKNDTGEWSQGDTFDPTFWGNDYTETDAYNMLVTVPQDGYGLANLYGGTDALGERMDTIFNTKGTYKGYNAVNSVGGIHEQKEAREVKLGQYGHSNQPSHGILYMYNYAQQPWKTQAYVRDVLHRCYVGGSFGQGYIGDEDNGEMSAWYVLSSLGFFPVSMGSGEYAIGSPLFDKATIHLENGQDLTIIANNNSDENVYIQSMNVNGETYNSSFISTETLMQGGTITFNMGNTPNTSWGTEKTGASITQGDEVANPLEDLTVPQVDVSNSFNEEVYNDTVVGNDIQNIKNLFDNNSDNIATFTEDTTIYYSYTRPVKVSMMTLTSTKDQQTKAPNAFTLYGSTDGENWTPLTNKENVTFEWGRYTRPFSVDNQDTGYQHYKLALTGGTTLSEIELLGQLDDYSPLDKTELSRLVLRALTMDQTQMSEGIKMLLNTAITNAQSVLDKEDVSQEEITKEYVSLQDIIKRIVAIRDGLTKLEAETYDSSHLEIKNDGTNIGGVKKDTWVGYKDMDFEVAPTEIEVNFSTRDFDSCEKGQIEVRLDSREGDPLFVIDTTYTGGWDKYQKTTVSIPEEVREQFLGLHDVYFSFVGNDPIDKNALYVANIDYFDFNANYIQEVNKEGNGEITTTDFNIAYGNTFTLDVEPEIGYKTIRITMDGEEIEGFIPGTNTIEIEDIDKAHTFVVTFAEDKEFTLSTSEGLENMNVTFMDVNQEEIETAKVGEIITINVVNNDDSKIIDSITANGKEIAVVKEKSSTNIVTGSFVMPYDDVEVNIILSDAPTHVVNVVQENHGQIETTGNVGDYIVEGKTLTIKAIPDAGYKVSQIIVNNQVVNSIIQPDKSAVYVIENVTEAMEIEVVFVVDRNTEALTNVIQQAKTVVEAAKLQSIDTMALEGLINEAQAILDDETKMQEAVDVAVTNLTLELYKIDLQVAILEAEDKDLSKYTEASIAEYQEIIIKAKEWLKKTEITKEEIAQMLKELESAKSILIEKTIDPSVKPNTDDTSGNNHGTTNQTNNVKTGDSNGIQEYIGVMLVMMAVAIICTKKKKYN